MRFAPALLVGAAVLLCATQSASAIIVNITHAGTASGTLGGVAFTSRAFTITAVADSANRMDVPNAYLLPHTSAHVSLAGLGEFDFLSPTLSAALVGNGSGQVGFGTAQFALIDGPAGPDFATYDFLTDIGPITAGGQILQWSRANLNTTGGVLIFNNASATPITYQGDAVPAPACVLPLGLAAAALRRRRATGR